MVSRCRSVALAGLALLTLVVSACEKVPLMAPTGSTITLSAPTNALGVNGSTDVVAQVLEAAGTPPHSGTRVTFLTTLGRIEPADATTDASGRVVVKFLPGGNSGTALISATSGGASTGATGALRIAVGAAAVGRVSLSANPNPVSINGGVASITASVVDLNGNPLASVPVTFSTSAGALGASVVTTDGSGVAHTTLATASQATVTATVGVQSSGTSGTGAGTGTGTGTGNAGSTTTQASATVTVNVNPLPTVSITAPTGTLTAGSPLTFTLNIAPGTNSTAQVRQVTVDFGDGDTVNLGAVTGSALTVGHRYEEDGTFVVRVSVTDTLGGVTQAATVVVVLPEPPLAVTITQTSAVSGANTIYTFTATVTPGTTTVSSYYWTFDGGSPQVTTSPQVIKSFPTGSGPHTVSVTITTSTGRTATSQIVVTP